MSFADTLLLLVMLLIFIVIIFNLFAYGRDLVIFPPKMRRVRESERYPGSPDFDEYTDDEDSDTDDYYDGDYEYNQYDYDLRRREENRRKVNPKKVAYYVASHLPNNN